MKMEWMKNCVRKYNSLHCIIGMTALFVMGICTPVAQAQTTSGTITGSETWSDTVFLTGDVTITDTGQLTIQPGTRIVCEPQFDDQVKGKNTSRIEIIIDGGIFIAEGTETSPITFTSGANEPDDDDWYGLRIISDEVTLRYCVVEYTNIGLHIEQNGLPIVENCTIREAKYDGIRIDTPDTYVFDSCTISHNNNVGVSSTKRAAITLTDCIVTNNAKGGLYIDGETRIIDCTISNNLGNGATVRGSNSNHYVTNSVFSDNSDTGLNTSHGVSFTISNCTFEQNGADDARSEADGIYGTSPLNITNCYINGNTGAGISLTEVGTGGITGNVITGNKYGMLFNSREPVLEISGGNDIYNNIQYELINEDSAAIRISDNYLGELTNQELREGKPNPTKIFDSRDDRSVGEIFIYTSLSSSIRQTPIPNTFRYTRTIPADITTVAAGSISDEQTWSGTVFLLGDVTITETGKLTIQAGTQILCDPTYDNQVGGKHTSRIELIVDGGILAVNGTSTSQVRFTSLEDLPQKDDWYGLRIISDQVTLRHSIIEYGNIGLFIEQNGLPVVENSTIQECLNDGIQIETPNIYELKSCTILNNDSYGVNSTNNATLTMIDCAIGNNGKDGLNISGLTSLTGCDVYGNQGFGANIRGARLNHTISNCTFRENTKTGLSTGVGSTFTITGCTISNNGLSGSRATADGISGTAPLNILNCIISDNSGAGILMSAVGEQGVTGNIINGNRYGIVFNSRESRINLSSGNDIYNNIEYELQNDNIATIVVNDNYLGELTTQELQQSKVNLTKIFDSRDDRTVGEILISTSLDSSTQSAPTPNSFRYVRDVPDDITQVASGLITGEQTWSGKVFILGDVTIAETGTLTIQEGTQIVCDPVYDNQAGGVNTSRIEIIVDGGILVAIGSQSSPIRFTSAAETPELDDWFGLRIRSDKVTLRHCTAEYGNVGLLIEQNGRPVVENSVFQLASTDGIRIEAPDTYVFTACTLRNNGDYGLKSLEEGLITMNNCTIDTNGSDGIYIDGKTTLQQCNVYGNQNYGVNLRGDDFTHLITDTHIHQNVKTGLNIGRGISYTIRNCVIEKNGEAGGRTEADGIYSTSPLNISNCFFTGNSGSGISLTYIGEEGITGNVINGNKYGITFNSREDSLTLSEGNDIFNNTEYELNNQNTAAIIVNNNYLGELTTQELNADQTNLTKIYDSRDNRSVGAINIRTWASTPNVQDRPTPTPTATPTPTNTPRPILPTATPTPTPISQPSERGDVNQDGRVTPGDAQLAFDLYIDLITGVRTASPPFSPGTDIWEADYNDDSRITPGDAQAIFDKYIESISGKTTRTKRTLSYSAKSLLPSEAATVEVGNAEGNPGDTVTIPLSVTEGVGIRAFSLELQYDSTQLEYVELDRSGTTTADFSSVVGIPLQEKIVISGFAGSAEAITGNAVFVKVLFKILPSASGEIPLTPAEFLDDLSGALGVPGNIQVIGSQSLQLSVGTVPAQAGDLVTVPITIRGADNVRSFSFNIVTDFQVLRFSKVEKNGTLTQEFSSLVGIQNADGGVTVAGFAGAANPVTGEGKLVDIVFEVQESISPAISVTLTELLDDLASALVIPGEVTFAVNTQGWLLY